MEVDEEFIVYMVRIQYRKYWDREARWRPIPEVGSLMWRSLGGALLYVFCTWACNTHDLTGLTC